LAASSQREHQHPAAKGQGKGLCSELRVNRQCQQQQHNHGPGPGGNRVAPHRFLTGNRPSGLSASTVSSGWAQLTVAVLVCAAVGALTGLISLRTTGIAFIMITLAFAQMFYYLFVSLKQYGGDDGLSIAVRSDFGLFTLASPTTLYYAALLLVLLALLATHRLATARFGMVLRGCQTNERRMKSMGFATLRYKLLAYILASVLCGLAGLLYGNLTGFASPAYMAWTLSGELIVMVVLGGMGTVFGPLVGALVLLISEELLKALTDHWMMILGPLIVLAALSARRGVYGYLLDWDAYRDRRRARQARQGRSGEGL
ncbi:MAG: branched-chain amino acid ABC transporter permease, partial [Betaproteobacteria bacterium]|nr:branched-chain amino acid ABC transporter permease [Betaproteobacteria bacterium]